MALFPKCAMAILVPDGAVFPGKRLEGELVLTAPKAIPRARHVELVFESTAWVDHGSGKGQRRASQVIFLAPFRFDIPGGRLAAGEHRFPFGAHVPAWLPSQYRGDRCAIEHVIKARLAVAWAADPSIVGAPVIVLRAAHGVRKTTTVRSPPGFHDSIVLDVTMDSSVIVEGQPFTGRVALRGGAAARFESVTLVLAGEDTMVTVGGERRRKDGPASRIPADRLRSGEPVPFALETRTSVVPTFRTGVIDHGGVLVVTVDRTWTESPTFSTDVVVLPYGSSLGGEITPKAIGGERLRDLSAALAAETGLRQGRPPVLVEGNDGRSPVDGPRGPVAVRVADSPRGAELGFEVTLTFPSVELGTVFRPLGVLDAFRESPLAPPPLRKHYLLRVGAAKHRPVVDDATCAAFFACVLAGLDEEVEVRLSDHALAFRRLVPNDEEATLIRMARFAQTRARDIVRAIDALPFPKALAASEAAWTACAAEQGALLVPTGPSLYDLRFVARVHGGEPRVAEASLRTAWTEEGPTTEVHLDLRDVALPEAAWAELEGDSSNERLRALRAELPHAEVLDRGRAVRLRRPSFAEEPRRLLPAVEAFVGWVLAARGEWRADAPYR